MSWKYIDKIGVEIEGCWHKKRDDLVEDAGIQSNLFKNPVSWGELVSEPLSSNDEMLEFLKKNWPEETHKMAGLHFHFSFKDLSMYCAFMNKKFHKHFIESMKKFGESYPIQNNYFWERLEDGNKFCRDRFAPEDQIFLKKKVPNDPGRYTQLHFAYGLHKTIESRILPTFITVECAVAGFLAHVECFESFLEQNPPKPFEFKKEDVLLEEIEEDSLDVSKIFENPKKTTRTAPFNLFMVKGIVRHAAFGPKTLDIKKSLAPKSVYIDATGLTALNSPYSDAVSEYKSKKPTWAKVSEDDSF